jgi:agmatinase
MSAFPVFCPCVRAPAEAGKRVLGRVRAATRRGEEWRSAVTASSGRRERGVHFSASSALTPSGAGRIVCRRAPVDANEVRAAWERARRRVAAEDRIGGPLPTVPPTFAGVPRASRPEDLEGAGAVVLGIPFGGPPGAPEAVRRASLGGAPVMPEGSADPADVWPAALERLGVVDYGDVAVVDDDVETTFMHAHERLADIAAAGAAPIVLGGDHSVTIAVLQVLAGILSGRLGIVALDARLDLAFEPRYAAGSQWARALELGVVDPANVAVVGLRESGQAPLDVAVARELGLRTYSTIDVDGLGIATVAQEALEIAAAGTEAIYVSLDLSVAGRADAEATGCPPGGLGGRELATAVRTLASGRVAGLDVCGPSGGVAFDAALARHAACAAAQLVVGLAAQQP